MKKLEMTGYLYIRSNGYDMYYVDEVYLDEDVSDVFYEDLDDNSYRASWMDPSCSAYKGVKKKAVKNIREGTPLAKIIEEKLGLEPGSSTAKFIRGKNDYYTKVLHTFTPTYRKVRITIEALSGEDI